MSDNFYDDDWKRLFRQHSLVAKKIETLRCETVSYQEFEELREKIGKLENKAPKDEYEENDFERLFWKELQGTRGPFQRTNKIAKK